jgi:hypothetical protein
MKLEQAKAELKRLGISISRRGAKEYRVNFDSGQESTASYCPDLTVAINTGRIMAADRQQAQLDEFRNAMIEPIPLAYIRDIWRNGDGVYAAIGSGPLLTYAPADLHVTHVNRNKCAVVQVNPTPTGYTFQRWVFGTEPYPDPGV